jgi:Homing endonuclease associated repeat
MTVRSYHRWTHDQVLLAIQAWGADHDGVPPSKAQWRRYSRGHPNVAVVRRLFGNWSAAIRAAGLSPRKGRVRWTDEAILDVLRQWTQEHGPPRATDWNAVTPEHPARRLVTTRFGSWDAALRAAGITSPSTPHKWSRDAIATAMQAWAQEHQRPPRAMDWQHGSPSHPARGHVWRQFGSWEAALQAAELVRHSQPSGRLGVERPARVLRRRPSA